MTSDMFASYGLNHPHDFYRWGLYYESEYLRYDSSTIYCDSHYKLCKLLIRQLLCCVVFGIELTVVQSYCCEMIRFPEDI